MKIFFVLILLVSQAFAVEMPTVQNIVGQGYEGLEVLKCPVVDERFNDILNQLTALKTQIKSDANCAPVQTKVGNLDELTRVGRDRFLGLVEKGKTEPLSEGEAAEIKKYVGNLTTMAAHVVDLLSQSNYCFNDDKSQGLGLAAVAGIISEAANLSAQVAGPYGAPLTLGGQLISGFLLGLDKVMKSRVGYKFDDPVQVKSYADNLCAYYNYRSGLDALLWPEQRLQELSDLGEQLDHHIARVRTNCSYCDKIYQAYHSQEYQGMVTQKKWKDFLNTTADDVQLTNLSYEKSLGTHLIKTLAARQWIQVEEERLQQESSAGDVGLYLVQSVVEDLDQFLFQKTAVQFVKHFFGTTQTELKLLEHFENREGSLLLLQVTSKLQGLKDFSWGDGRIAKRIFTINPDDKRLEDHRELLLAFRNAYKMRLSKLIVSQSIVENYCNFFRHAGFYNQVLKGQCQGSGIKAMQAEVRQRAAEVGMQGAVDKKIQVRAEVDYTRDWVESLQQFLDKTGQLSDTDFFIRREGLEPK